jgi:hypothetical protein
MFGASNHHTFAGSRYCAFENRDGSLSTALQSSKPVTIHAWRRSFQTTRPADRISS